MKPMRRFGVLCALCVTALASCAYEARELTPRIPRNAQSSMVFAGDGSLLTVLHAEENREEIPYERIPTTLRDAIIAIEDERFWDHRGVDLRAVLRAFRANTEAASIAQGASTITQQLVKNTLLDTEQTLERKVQEASLAWQLERRFTKERILELYLNTIYFGNGAYGVQMAARSYFGKSVDQLTLAESAMLAGLIRSPNEANPFTDPTAATARRDVVVEKMRSLGMIDEATATAARAEPLVVVPRVTPLEQRYVGGHFVEEVKQFVLDDRRFGPSRTARRDLLFSGGLRIYTTLDVGLQAAAEAAVAEVLPDPATDPEVAIVAVEPSTGYVRAMVGGRDFFGASAQAKYNLAMGRGRQTGSAFKPFVLAAALEQGIPLTTAFPAPGHLTLDYGAAEPWEVDNYGEGGSDAPVDLVEGTVKSYNTLYAQLILRVGMQTAVDTAADLGIATHLDPFPSAVLGTNLVRPLDMAAAYATFANRGVRVPPTMVTRITTADGTVLYERRHTQERVLDADLADTVTSVLRQVIERGTGTAAQFGRPAAGKTGTSQEWKNAWFCGYTPQLSAAVWVGFPGETELSMTPPLTPIRVTGGSYPARIWQAFMRAALAEVPPVEFVAPPTTTTTVAAALPALTEPGVTVPPGPGGGGGGGGTGEQDVVPNEAGLPDDEAVATLGAYDLRAQRVDVKAPGPKDRVLSQSPNAGSRVPSGSVVTLEVRS
jgi:penicillin-binding protein 1A